MGTSRPGLLGRVLLPSALPEILTGARIALGFALVIAIAAEMIAAKAGIGKLMFLYGENGAYAYMFAAVTAVVAVACLADVGFAAFSNHILRWRERLRAEA